MAQRFRATGGIDELFEAYRQQEIHIRTLQMLLEMIAALEAESYSNWTEWTMQCEKAILGKIKQATESADDPELGEQVRTPMCKIVVEFFQNVRSMCTPRPAGEDPG